MIAGFDVLPWQARLAELELALLTTWCKAPRFRASWTPEPNDFWNERCRAVARACATLAALGTSGDDLGTALVEQLYQSGDLKRHWTAADSPLAVTRYYGSDIGARLNEWRGLRTSFAALKRLQETLLGATVGVDPSELRGRILEAVESCYVGGGLPAFTEADLARMALMSATRKDPPGATVGLPRLDLLTGGVRPGDIWCVGAPTNWGKSSLLLSILDQHLTTGSNSALYVTCEDAPELLAVRLAARRCEISAMAIRDGKAGPSEVDALGENLVTASRQKSGVVMLDGRGRRVEEIAASVRQHCAADGAKLVLVDYVQCIRAGAPTASRYDEVNLVMRELADAIHQSGAGGVLASQLTDENLRGSRELEHAAEVVLIGKTAANGDKSLWLKKNKTGPAGEEVSVRIDQTTGALQQAVQQSAYPSAVDDGFRFDNE